MILQNIFSSKVKLQSSLPFNLLKVTRDYGYNITPRTKIQGNFLVESDNLEDGAIGFREERQWKVGTLNFAHILRDQDENIVTVNLQERITLTETTYVMDKETFKELQNVSEDFEELLTKEIGNSHSGSPGIRNDYNSDADDSNSSEDTSDIEQIIAYQDRTSRRGSGNRYENILLRLKYSWYIIYPNNCLLLLVDFVVKTGLAPFRICSCVSRNHHKMICLFWECITTDKKASQIGSQIDLGTV